MLGGPKLLVNGTWGEPAVAAVWKVAPDMPDAAVWKLAPVTPVARESWLYSLMLGVAAPPVGGPIDASKEGRKSADGRGEGRRNVSTHGL
jgi:hypothetical protein